MFNRFVDGIKKNNANNMIIWLAAISFFCYLLMGTNIFGIQSEFDSKYMLDLVFYYSGDTFFETLVNIPEVQAGYYSVTHYIDYLFILTFYPTLVLILSRGIRNKNQYFILAPLFAMLFDFLENLIIDIQLSSGVNTFFASICGIFTTLKFSFIFISIILIVVNFINKRRNMNHVII